MATPTSIVIPNSTQLRLIESPNPQVIITDNGEIEILGSSEVWKPESWNGYYQYQYLSRVVPTVSHPFTWEHRTIGPSQVRLQDKKNPKNQVYCYGNWIFDQRPLWSIPENKFQPSPTIVPVASPISGPSASPISSFRISRPSPTIRNPDGSIAPPTRRSKSSLHPLIPAKTRLYGGRYEIIKELGRGTFGITYLATDFETSHLVAIKTIDPQIYTKHKGIPTIEDEIFTLQELSVSGCNPYIVCYQNSFEEGVQIPLSRSPAIGELPYTTKRMLCIITEYIDGISLHAFNRIVRSTNSNSTQDTSLTVPNIIGLWFQLLLGLKTIHEAGFAHRDIKPGNIMVDEKIRIKYIDFGFACVQACHRDGCGNICSNRPGTPSYMPPEIARRDTEVTLQTSQAHDIWALGITMYEMINQRRYPFDHISSSGITLPNDVLLKNIRTAPKYPSSFSGDFADNRLNRFVMFLLHPVWDQRPTINQAIQEYTDTVLTKVDWPRPISAPSSTSFTAPSPSFINTVRFQR